MNCSSLPSLVKLIAVPAVASAAVKANFIVLSSSLITYYWNVSSNGISLWNPAVSAPLPAVSPLCLNVTTSPVDKP